MEPSSEQLAIQNSDDSTIIVAANAGAAKTTTLAFRIAEGLRRGIAPSRIISLTYTEPARRALRSALTKIGLSSAACDGLWIDTFEGFSRRLLKKFDGDQPGEAVPVASAPEALAPYVWQAVEALREAQEQRWDDHLHLPHESHADSSFVERFLKQASRIKGMLALDRALMDERRLDPDLAIDLNADYTLLRLQLAYEAIRRPPGADRPRFRGIGDATYDLARLISDLDGGVSIDDLPGWPHQTSAVMVDEMHDLNRAMFTVLCALLRPRSVYFCGVGDADQVIHAADGAERFFMEQALPLETTRRVHSLPLTRTHRFGSDIAQAAGRFANKPYQSVAGLSSTRVHLKYGAGHGNTCHQQVTQLAAQWRAGKRKMSDFAVLLRHAAQSVPIENALLDAEIPYVTTGFDSYLVRPEVLLVRGLMAIAQHNFDAIHNPDTRKLIVQEVVFFCGVTLDFADDADESPASRLKEAMRHVSGEPSALASFFEHQVLKNASPSTIPRLKRALEILQAPPQPSTFSDFLAALDIRRWAREVWVEQQRHEDAVAHFEGLRQAAHAFRSPEAFFLSLNAAELKQQTMRRQSSAFMTLASVPSVKGLEFGHVVIPYLEAGLFPAQLDDTVSDERALFYVAMTRAREALTLLSPQNKPSPFIAEIENLQS